MRTLIDIAPPHSLVLVMDPSIGQLPDGRAGPIAATSTCIAIGTRSEYDGTTRISIGDMLASGSGREPVFEGVLETPGGRIAVCSVFDEVILEIPIELARTRVQIWANDQSAPSEIDILVSRSKA